MIWLKTAHLALKNNHFNYKYFENREQKCRDELVIMLYRYTHAHLPANMIDNKLIYLA